MWVNWACMALNKSCAPPLCIPQRGMSHSALKQYLGAHVTQGETQICKELLTSRLHLHSSAKVCMLHHVCPIQVWWVIWVIGCYSNKVWNLPKQSCSVLSRQQIGIELTAAKTRPLLANYRLCRWLRCTVIFTKVSSSIYAGGFPLSW